MRNARAIVAAIVAGCSLGCSAVVPLYQEPSGFSETYRRYLLAAESTPGGIWGPVSAGSRPGAGQPGSQARPGDYRLQ